MTQGKERVPVQGLVTCTADGIFRYSGTCGSIFVKRAAGLLSLTRAVCSCYNAWVVSVLTEKGTSDVTECSFFFFFFFFLVS